MIGVIASPADRDVVSEFFELFKTPWEFYRRERQYDVLLCAGDGQFDSGAKLMLYYAGRRVNFDDQQEIQTGEQGKQPCVLSYAGYRIPIYGDTVTFSEKQSSLLTIEGSQQCAAFLEVSGDSALARIGYDLFSEIRTLVTAGQPPANATIPALELHIALLRDLITGSGVPLVEIPPVPNGYPFVVCLTHDVDHPAMRQHKLDHTMVGFFYRAVFGSVRKLIYGEMSVRDLLKNWAAAVKLPFVQMGLAKDFWRDFDDRYLELEKGLGSTFYMIPFSNRPGSDSDGPAPAVRAARYGAQDIADTIRKLIAAGCEVGLHGIDAWVDSRSGREELEEIRRLTGDSEIGVRMHWLYYDAQSPLALETAGATYDATIGYNGTVGYRAGTTQVFKPLGVSQLLELPLHVMDTALFYPNHLALTPRRARALIDPMVENAVRFGGILTINWHDRSLAPERWWGGCYCDLLQDLKSRGAWFSTAGQATSWFRKRRSASFEGGIVGPSAVRAKVAVDRHDVLPGLQLRVHKPRKAISLGTHHSEDYVDMAVDETIETTVCSEATR
jgi:hypothetical protein